MPLRRLLERIRLPRATRPSEPAAETRGQQEILAGLELEFRRVQVELQALEAAVIARRSEQIPDTLQVPAAQAGGPPRPTVADPAMEARWTQLREMLEAALRERDHLQRLLEVLRQRPSWAEAGARLRPLCQEAFHLFGFYLAMADWEAGWIRFPYFFGAGRPGAMAPMPLAPAAGLTGWALHEPGPCYLDSLESCLARGMRLTEAERQSGLLTRSWFGAPMPGPDPARPLGLMAFHCYEPAAFGPDRRRLMTLTARLTALHLHPGLENGAASAKFGSGRPAL